MAHTLWQPVSNNAIGAPNLAHMGASFALMTGRMLAFCIAVPPNGSSVRLCVVGRISGAVSEQEITAGLPAATQVRRHGSAWTMDHGGGSRIRLLQGPCGNGLWKGPVAEASVRNVKEQESNLLVPHAVRRPAAEPGKATIVHLV